MGSIVSVSPFRDAPAWVKDPFGQPEPDNETQLANFKPESPYPFSLPEDALEAARLAGASPDQLKQAAELARHRLTMKAKRQACCGVYGRRCTCSKSECGHHYFRKYRCRNRYCLTCGPSAYADLFGKHKLLAPPADALCAKISQIVRARLEFTSIDLNHMATCGEVRLFNQCIKRFCRRLQRAVGIGARDWSLHFDELAGEGTTKLHAHAVYVGPKIPDEWFGEGKPLSDLWRETCRGRARSFEESSIDLRPEILAGVIAKLDFTSVKLNGMPTHDEVRLFNECIKNFCRRLQRALGVRSKDWGLVYCDEFGGRNNNLHAHGVYVGPKIPHEWFGKGKRLSEMWKEACQGTPFEGSFIISAKVARSFGQGLGHALKRCREISR
jgi:hypothetical protein